MRSEDFDHATKADQKFNLMALDDPDLEPVWAEIVQI
jgi:hypothetical protein